MILPLGCQSKPILAGKDVASLARYAILGSPPWRFSSTTVYTGFGPGVKMTPLHLKFCGCWLAVTVTFSASAQFVRGTVQGLVTDEQDAVIDGAAVTLKNLATNESRQVQTDSRGE